MKSLTTVIGLSLVMSLFACGRTTSRYLGEDHRQTLEVENLKDFISLSYDFRDGENVKDVTYLATDGYVYTVEFKDASPLEGTIRWVPYNEEESHVQSRALSRVFGTPVNLKLPEDCQKILGVDVTYAGGSSRTKNVTYLSTDGKILSHEYREGIVARHFEGWLEIKTK